MERLGQGLLNYSHLFLAAISLSATTAYDLTIQDISSIVITIIAVGTAIWHIYLHFLRKGRG